MAATSHAHTEPGPVRKFGFPRSALQPSKWGSQLCSPPHHHHPHSPPPKWAGGRRSFSAMGSGSYKSWGPNHIRHHSLSSSQVLHISSSALPAQFSFFLELTRVKTFEFFDLLNILNRTNKMAPVVTLDFASETPISRTVQYKKVNSRQPINKLFYR